MEVSCDSVPVQLAWVTANFQDNVGKAPLVLSDFWPHGQTCRDYGVMNEETGMPMRSMFVIDTDSTILHSELVTERGVLPDVEAAINMVADLP